MYESLFGSEENYGSETMRRVTQKLRFYVQSMRCAGSGRGFKSSQFPIVSGAENRTQMERLFIFGILGNEQLKRQAF